MSEIILKMSMENDVVTISYIRRDITLEFTRFLVEFFLEGYIKKATTFEEILEGYEYIEYSFLAARYLMAHGDLKDFPFFEKYDVPYVELSIDATPLPDGTASVEIRTSTKVKRWPGIEAYCAAFLMALYELDDIYVPHLDMICYVAIRLLELEGSDEDDRSIN